MRPLRLAILFDQKSSFSGGFQQSLNAALLANNLPKHLVQPIFFTLHKESLPILSQHGIRAIHLNFTFFNNLCLYIRRSIRSKLFHRFIPKFLRKNCFEVFLSKHNIDLVYFLSPSSRALDLSCINFISTVWDLSHRDHPEFPEVRLYSEFESREFIYSSTLSKAIAIFVDSELSKTNAVLRYGIEAERIYVMPFQASSSIRLNKPRLANSALPSTPHHRLDIPYLFYPAQFWAHKNHVYVLEGLDRLKRLYGISLGAIFTGGDLGNLSYVKQYAADLSLSDVVIFPGYVSESEITDFYLNSLALIMPTYFGHTNLPPLEAFELGVPVLYPNMAGLRDQVGEAALLFDLMNPDSLAEQLYRLLNEPGLRDSLIKLGYKRLEYFDSYNRSKILFDVLLEFRSKRVCWR